MKYTKMGIYGNLPNMADLLNKFIIYTRKNILMSVDSSII